MPAQPRLTVVGAAQHGQNWRKTDDDDSRAQRAAAATGSLSLALAAAIFLNDADRGMVAVAGPLIKSEMHLSATAFGLAVSAFFWGYAPAQVLVGGLVDRFRVYRLYGGGAVRGLATAATSLVGGFAPLLTLQIMLGIGESVAFPGGSKIIARDIPARRGIVNAGISAGGALGPAFGTLAGGFILAAYGWRPMFAVFGIATLLPLVPWQRLTGHIRDLPPGPAAAAGSTVGDPAAAAALDHQPVPFQQ